jgi:hypothetical protein
MHLLVERKNRKTVSKEHGNSTRLQFLRLATIDLSDTQHLFWSARPIPALECNRRQRRKRRFFCGMGLI